MTPFRRRLYRVVFGLAMSVAGLVGDATALQAASAVLFPLLIVWSVGLGRALGGLTPGDAAPPRP